MDASRSPASAVGAGLSSGRLSSRGWLIKRPGFHRGAGLSSGLAFIVGLAFRAARLSLWGWLFERSGFHRGPGFSIGLAVFLGLALRAAAHFTPVMPLPASSLPVAAWLQPLLPTHR